MAKQKYWDGTKWVQIAPSMAEFGDKSKLLTTNKTSLVDALNELFTNANNGKTAVANAVTAKGVAASPSDTFSVLATKIGQIITGKKFRAGVVKSSAGRQITITALDFTPKLLLFWVPNNPTIGIYQTYNNPSTMIKYVSEVSLDGSTTNSSQYNLTTVAVTNTSISNVYVSYPNTDYSFLTLE